VKEFETDADKLQVQKVHQLVKQVNLLFQSILLTHLLSEELV